MAAIFKRKLFSNWLMILGWGIGLALLGYYLITFYDTFYEQNIDLSQMIQAFPEELLAFFGEDTNPVSPKGFLTLEFFSYIPLILGILVVSNTSKLIRSREEDGTLELILAQPISRSKIFWGHVLAYLLSLILILFITWAGFALGLQVTTEIDLNQGELALPFVSLLALLVFFSGLALLLSMVMPSGTAGLISGFFMVASFFITSFSRIDQNLEVLNLFSPLKYYQSGEAVAGLDVGSALLLVGLGGLFLILGWIIFAKRDMRFNA